MTETDNLALPCYAVCSGECKQTIDTTKLPYRCGRCHKCWNDDQAYASWATWMKDMYYQYEAVYNTQRRDEAIRQIKLNTFICYIDRVLHQCVFRDPKMPVAYLARCLQERPYRCNLTIRNQFIQSLIPILRELGRVQKRQEARQ